jgi:hypothetical protein
MTAVASEGVPGTRRQLRERLRATVLGPRGGGTTRRRASDAFRVGLAVVVVAVSVPVMRANSAVELSIVRALNPPPNAISWLVTSVFWLGSAGVIALLVVVGLLIPRLHAIRWVALAGLLTWGVCVLLGALLGPAAGRPSISEGSGGVNKTAVWIVLAVIIAAGIVAALISLVSRIRRLASRRIRPHLLNIWANVKLIAAEPRKIVYVLAWMRRHEYV